MGEGPIIDGDPLLGDAKKQNRYHTYLGTFQCILKAGKNHLAMTFGYSLLRPWPLGQLWALWNWPLLLPKETHHPLGPKAHESNQTQIRL